MSIILCSQLYELVHHCYRQLLKNSLTMQNSLFLQVPGVQGLAGAAPWSHSSGSNSVEATARAAAEGMLDGRTALKEMLVASGNLHALGSTRYCHSAAIAGFSELLIHCFVAWVAPGEVMTVPGASRNAFGAGDVDAFLAGLGPRSAGGAGPMPHEFAQFEAIYQSARPDWPLGDPMPGAGLPGLTPFLRVRTLDPHRKVSAISVYEGPLQLSALHTTAKRRCLVQAFLASAKVHGVFQPQPSPPLQLTQLDQCRIRDRSTIMARHLFADRGDVFADEQVWPAVVQH